MYTVGILENFNSPDISKVKLKLKATGLAKTILGGNFYEIRGLLL